MKFEEMSLFTRTTCVQIDALLLQGILSIGKTEKTEAFILLLRGFMGVSGAS